MHDTLKIARVKRNLTLQRLHTLTGLRMATLNEIETGLRQPFESTKQKIERALGCEVDWLTTYRLGRTLRQAPDLIIENQTDNTMEHLFNPGQVEKPAPEEPENKIQVQQKRTKRSRLLFSATMSEKDIAEYNQELEEEAETEEEAEEKLLPPSSEIEDEQHTDDEILMPPLERKTPKEYPNGK